MAGSVYITQSDLEQFYPSRTVRQIFCEDGSGTPGAQLAIACEAASRGVDAILLSEWTAESIEVLVREDSNVRRQCCRLAMAQGIEGKTEWIGEGSPFAGLEEKATKALKDLAASRSKSRGESLAGQNAGATGYSAPARAEPTYMFAPTRSNPRPRGF